jgi:hypothetical protein
MKHIDFRRGGVISVWVGNFRSDVELDDYLNSNSGFSRDFGFEVLPEDAPETVVEDQRMSIPALVTGFSWSDAYKDAVSELADKEGIKSATTMIVFFNFEYDPSFAALKAASPLRFLGSVPFHPSG